jgi:Alkylmercury lyase
MARVELLFFDGCPNHEALEPHLRALLRRRWPDADLVLRRVESEEDARRLGFLGSPSVRVDGRDVEPGAEARDDFGLKCRLYRVGDRLVGAPPDAWIVDALDEGLSRLRTRSALNRVADVSGAARALHRRILLAFAAGTSPPADERDLLAELEQRDLIGRDPVTSEVVVAYPFSARETPHRVELIDDGTRVYAMCAIDALGIPCMLDRQARISSRDPDTAEPVELAIDPDGPSPASDVVVRVRTVGSGNSCDCLCPYVEFLARRPATGDATILDLPAALALSRDIFGSLLPA